MMFTHPKTRRKTRSELINKKLRNRPYQYKADRIWEQYPQLTLEQILERKD